MKKYGRNAFSNYCRKIIIRKLSREISLPRNRGKKISTARRPVILFTKLHRAEQINHDRLDSFPANRKICMPVITRKTYASSPWMDRPSISAKRSVMNRNKPNSLARANGNYSPLRVRPRNKGKPNYGSAVRTLSDNSSH